MKVAKRAKCKKSQMFWALVACFGAAACAEPEPAPEQDAEPTVVLVHGAWHQPDATWGAVTSELDARGIAWRMVDLPSADPEPGPDGTLPGFAADVEAAREVIDDVDGPVVLVGHSYGGFVLSDVGFHPDVVHLTYLCAFVPETGDTLIQLAASEPPPLIGMALRPDLERGLLSVDPALAGEVFYADVPTAQAEQAVAALVPSTAAVFETPAAEVAWRERDTTYVVCQQDNAITPARSREMAARLSGDTFELDTSHSPFLSQPSAVADILEDIVRPAGE